MLVNSHQTNILAQSQISEEKIVKKSYSDPFIERIKKNAHSQLKPQIKRPYEGRNK